jgi:hypothetical protein
MKKILLIILCLIPSAIHAETIKVEASGLYTGPLHTNPSPVVVELFSSQNCPACPPADAYLGELSKSKDLITISCHVNYFGQGSGNLGKQICTDRQTRYITQMGRKSHFTPQMMVNGHMSEIGYEQANVAATITKARSERLHAINIEQKAKNAFSFSVPQMQVNGDVEIWIAVFQKPKTFKERGRSVTYSNVLKEYKSLGRWKGKPLASVVTPKFNNQSAGFAIVAQEVDSGKIIAAGQYHI